MIKIYVIGAALAAALSGCAGCEVIEVDRFPPVSPSEAFIPTKIVIADRIDTELGVQPFSGQACASKSCVRKDTITKAKAHSARVVGTRLHG